MNMELQSTVIHMQGEKLRPILTTSTSSLYLSQLGLDTNCFQNYLNFLLAFLKIAIPYISHKLA